LLGRPIGILAVRVYYSPEVITWLENDRRGDVPNDGMMIKEMYPPPAVRYQGSSKWNLLGINSFVMEFFASILMSSEFAPRA
jgi:hypothetical protein